MRAPPGYAPASGLHRTHRSLGSVAGRLKGERVAPACPLAQDALPAPLPGAPLTSPMNWSLLEGACICCFDVRAGKPGCRMGWRALGRPKAGQRGGQRGQANRKSRAAANRLRGRIPPPARPQPPAPPIAPADCAAHPLAVSPTSHPLAPLCSLLHPQDCQGALLQAGLCRPWSAGCSAAGPEGERTLLGTALQWGAKVRLARRGCVAWELVDRLNHATQRAGPANKLLRHPNPTGCRVSRHQAGPERSASQASIRRPGSRNPGEHSIAGGLQFFSV